MADILDVYNPISYDESVSHYEVHSYIPYNTTRFENNDEIRITIQHQELNVLPCESSIHITGKICLRTDESKKVAKTTLVNNGICQLFEQIRYELNGVEIDRCKRVGLTSIMKGWASMNPQKEECLMNSGWIDIRETKSIVIEKGVFDVNIPLKMILGFAEDYKKIIINCRHELVLTRAHNDDSALVFTGEANGNIEDSKIKIDKIEWLVPHVQLSNEYKIRMLRQLERQKPIKMAFRSWELYEYPMLPPTDSHVWNVKTSNQLEKPRYAIIGFQTNRNGRRNNSSQFDSCDLTNVRLYLNATYYPYANLNLNIAENQYALLYEMFCKFQHSYYGKESEPAISRGHYIGHMPLVVIDCSKQNDSLKNAPVDVKVELQSKKSFPANTAAYCLLLHDRVVEYNPSTGDVRLSVA